MRYGALLASFLMFACGLLPQTSPRVLYPVTDATASLSFVDSASGWGPAPSSCEGKPYSNIACPFTLKRTIDFTAGWIEEQRCSCFPEILTQRLPIDAAQINEFKNRAKAIHTLNDKDMISASDMAFTSLIVRTPDSEQTFLYSMQNFKGSVGVFVDGPAAQGLSDAVSEQLQGVPSTPERALRKIFTAHHGFFLSYPLPLPKEFPLCPVQSSFLYKAAAQQVNVALCDGNRGMRFQTLNLDNAENERLLTALKALEAPTVESTSKSCSLNPVHFELYQADGTPEVYAINSVSCDGDWQARDDFRRRIFAPSAENFLNILSIYDNF